MNEQPKEVEVSKSSAEHGDVQQKAEELLKPEEKKRDIEKPKKRHRLRNFFIVLAIIIVVLMIAVAATGVYTIPGISSIFGFNEPKNLGVEISDEALGTLKDKIPLRITGEVTDYSSGSVDIFSGEMAVDTTITANEVSSWLQRYQRPDPLLSDLTVRQFEGGMEISAMVNQYVKAPVYAKVNVNLIDNNTVSIDIQEGKLGMFSVPEKYLDEVSDLLEKQVNSLIVGIPGFSIEEYELHDGYSKFKGTFPETVKPSANGWADLMDY